MYSNVIQIVVVKETCLLCDIDNDLDHKAIRTRRERSKPENTLTIENWLCSRPFKTTQRNQKQSIVKVSPSYLLKQTHS